MLMYPDIDPVAIQLGPLAVHWYGLMYGVGFLSAWLLGRYRAKQPWTPIKPAQMDDLLIYVALGVILGGRIGYALFYDTGNLLADPLRLLRIWEGGMAFHGGLLGVILACWIYAVRNNIPFTVLMDFVAPLVPIGLGAGRIGNFINGELWGRVTDLPWGMVYPPMGMEPRHPSQLYQFLLEGVVLFTAIWLFSSRPRPAMSVSGLFLVLYGLFRFLVEFIRIPDAHIGYLAFGWLTMGQLLSLPMILLGAGLLIVAYRVPGRASGH
ncbi:MAG: prolipoprotein diacylglyceryl transferase [Aquisalimonadaceae bacterium]